MGYAQNANARITSQLLRSRKNQTQTQTRRHIMANASLSLTADDQHLVDTNGKTVWVHMKVNLESVTDTTVTGGRFCPVSGELYCMAYESDYTKIGETWVEWTQRVYRRTGISISDSMEPQWSRDMRAATS